MEEGFLKKLVLRPKMPKRDNPEYMKRYMLLRRKKENLENKFGEKEGEKRFYLWCVNSGYIEAPKKSLLDLVLFVCGGVILFADYVYLLCIP